MLPLKRVSNLPPPRKTMELLQNTASLTTKSGNYVKVQTALQESPLGQAIFFSALASIVEVDRNPSCVNRATFLFEGNCSKGRIMTPKVGGIRVTH